jgi:hypothetical protein
MRIQFKDFNGVIFFVYLIKIIYNFGVGLFLSH